MIKEVKNIVEIAKSSGIKELYLKTKDVKITLKFSDGSEIVEYQQPVVHYEVEEQQEQDEALPKVEVKSPFVGIFRLNDKKGNSISSVGKNVSKGDILCNIEVLGVLNEITSPVSGKVSNILVKDGDIVDYGKVIIEITPND
ncbi:MAG: biotin/lipoyl-containing protein [Spirochaetia bacterium]|nr:biotin/lipoyl-binding protein [Spirochaetota bacterium]MCX8096005.1 biotin/lipoyl-binding protein [Spirochaetota bacterium]MDW8111800.1 biotin/lipoyl-containing protein [Spirochaetia bacterium]